MMRSGSTLRRLALVGAAVATLSLANVQAAFANWDSHIASWTDGNESRRWKDSGSYSQVLFQNCFAQNALNSYQQVVVQERVDKSLHPDQSLGTKTYTGCFKGSGSWSNGQWTNVPSGEHDLFFRTDKIGQGSSCCLLWVGTVHVDTTKADPPA